MEKKGNYTEMYKTTSGKLDNQTKLAILQFLTESLDFHTLVCDIAGNVRKEVKPEKGYEELKADYLHVCNRYKQEQERSNYLLHMWKEEKAKRMKAQAALGDSHSHHNNVMNRFKDLLKEVDMPSVKSAIEALKDERANGKLVAEQCELWEKGNDILAMRCKELEDKYDKLAKGYDNACKEVKTMEIKLKNISINYDRLIEDYNYLNTRYNNQKEYISKYTEENKRLTNKVEKLKGKLDKASKRYGELIKIIGDRAIKTI